MEGLTQGEDTAVREFVRWAREYCARVEDPTPLLPDAFYAEVARVLAALYAAAMGLPIVELLSEQVEEPPRPAPPPLTEKVAVQYYWHTYNPFEEELSCGDLLDDLTDIHADLRHGLTVWDRGTPQARTEAVWHWRLMFKAHWGKHAVDALTVLHQLCTEASR